MRTLVDICEKFFGNIGADVFDNFRQWFIKNARICTCVKKSQGYKYHTNLNTKDMTITITSTVKSVPSVTIDLMKDFDLWYKFYEDYKDETDVPVNIIYITKGAWSSSTDMKIVVWGWKSTPAPYIEYDVNKDGTVTPSK